LRRKHIKQKKKHFPYTTLFRSQRRKSSKKISIPKVFLEGQNATNNGQLVGKRVKDSILVKKKRKSIMDKKEDVTKKDYSQLKARSEEHTSELQSRENLVCRLLL